MMVDGSPNRGVTVANPTECKREGTIANSPTAQEDANRKDKDEEKEHQSTSGNKLETQASTTTSHSSRSRWLKLRTTVQLTGAMTQSHKKPPLKREDSFLKRFSTRQIADTSTGDGSWFCHGEPPKDEVKQKWWTLAVQSVINPDENFLFGWLWLLTACVLYNAWTLIIRQAFPEMQRSRPNFWYTMDGLSDFCFLLDIMVQFRTGYLEQGLMVCEAKKLSCHYLKSRPFLMDLIALIPVDLLQFYIGPMPILRIPRFFKVYRAIRFYYMAESRTIYPNLWRVINLVHILLLLAHWFGCFYFMLSELEEFKGEWAYPTQYNNDTLTRKYLASVYWSTLTLTTIGDLATPATNLQYLFTIVSYLIGVFIFATIVGQVGNVITNRNASRLEFERLLDGAKLYMRHHKVPRNMQRRVQRWYDYSWSRGRMQGGGDIHSALGSLPDKLKTELALHVNLKTLKKVSIFQECQPEFLHDLVLKMKAYIFTPGDLICRKGEIAREMFIIADGILEVISDLGKVLTQMKAGDFFGEIGILNLDGFNRRTADVRSVGYSELFSLSREDVLAAMKDYPEAQEILQTMGRKRLMEARLASSNIKKNDDYNIVRSPTGCRTSKARDSIDVTNANGQKSREMVKRLKHDVQSLRGLLRSKSIPVGLIHYRRQPDDGEEVELESLTSQQKASDSEYNPSERNSSIRKLIKKIRWRGDTETSQPLRGFVQRISCIKPQLSSDTSKASDSSPNTPSVTASPFFPPESVGKGLPLSERIKILKEKEKANLESNKIDNNRETDRRNSQQNHNESSGIIGEGLPLLERLKLLKAKEEAEAAAAAAASKNSEVKMYSSLKDLEPRTELPLLKRVLLLKKEEQVRVMSEESSKGKQCTGDEKPKLSTTALKKPNIFKEICKNMNTQKEEGKQKEDIPTSKETINKSNEKITQNKTQKSNLIDSTSQTEEQLPDNKEIIRPNSFSREGKIDAQLSVVREHSQSPPQDEDLSLELSPKETNVDKLEFSERPQVKDTHAARRTRLKRMFAVAENNTCESANPPSLSPLPPTIDSIKISSKDAFCQTEEDISLSREKRNSRKYSREERRRSSIRKSSDLNQLSDGEEEEVGVRFSRRNLYSPIEDVSPFNDGVQEYLIRIMKNVKQAMKTYVVEKHGELQARIIELENEIRQKDQLIRKLRSVLNIKDNIDIQTIPLSPFEDISSFEDTDLSSADTDTDHDLLNSTTSRSPSITEEIQKPKPTHHRYSWPSGPTPSSSRSRKGRAPLSSHSYEEPDTMSDLVFHPEEMWRVEFPSRNVFHEPEEIQLKDEESKDYSSSESDPPETIIGNNWEAKMLVEEYEKNRRRPKEGMMLWNWMVNRRSLQEWRRLQRQNNGNRMKRKLSLVDERTLDSWSSGDGSFFVRQPAQFLSTDHLQEATRPKHVSPHQPKGMPRRERNINHEFFTSSKHNLRRHQSLYENRRSLRLETPQWTSLEDTMHSPIRSPISTDEIRINERQWTTIPPALKSENYTSETGAGVLGWPSSPCLPTITEHDPVLSLSFTPHSLPIVNRSFSQDCLITSVWPNPVSIVDSHTSTCDDGASERHSESSEHGEDSPLIPFAHGEDTVVISVPEYETLLDP